ISPIVQFLIALIGLGVAIDYTLLVVVRWREERAHGLQGDEAIVRAMETAGRAVVFSGTTVAIGLLALIALPLPFLRSVGYGGMHGAVAPSAPQWRRASVAVVDAFPVADGSSGAGRDAIDRIRDAAHDAGDVRLGGLGAQNHDFIHAVYGNFPLMIALIAIITFVLLARAFRSLLLPLKAVILNVISVAAAWGVLALMWQCGHGSRLILGIVATGS